MWGQRLRKAGCPSCEAWCWSCPHACGPVPMLWPQEQPRGKAACPGPPSHTHPWLFFPWVTHLLRPPRNWLPVTLRVGFQFLSGLTLFKIEGNTEFPWVKQSIAVFWCLFCLFVCFCFFFPCIFISLRLITLQYYSGFCHTLKWISHGFPCIPHPDPPSHLPLYPIPLGLPSAPGPSTCLMHPAWAADLFHHR